MNSDDEINFGLEMGRHIIDSVAKAGGNGQNIMLVLQHAVFAVLAGMRAMRSAQGVDIDVIKLNDELHRNVQHVLLDAIEEDFMQGPNTGGTDNAS